MTSRAVLTRENAVVIARCSCVVSATYASFGGLVAHAGPPPSVESHSPLASYHELPNLVPQGAGVPRCRDSWAR